MESESFDRPPPLPPPLPPSPPLGPRRIRVWLWILASIPLLGVFCALVVAAAAAVFVLSARPQEVAERDKEVLVDVHRLAPWLGDYQINSSAESVAKTKYFDGSYDLDYTYDDSEDPESPYLNCSVAFERTRQDARSAYWATWGGGKLGLSYLSDVSIAVVERNDIFRWGDESRFAVLELEGRPIGNMFVMREGKIVYFLMFTGAAVEGADDVRSLLTAPLLRLRGRSS